jgi:hypothetical protein
MKKSLLFLIIPVSVLLITACSRSTATGAVSSIKHNKRAVLEPVLKRIMPVAIEDGMVKVALIRNMAAADYNGFIFSMGSSDFSYDFFLPAINSRVKIVTFDTLPGENDPRKDLPYGVTTTAQDEAELAELCLQALVDIFSSPIRLISNNNWYGDSPVGQSQCGLREISP